VNQESKMPLSKRKMQMLVLGGLALASYDVRAETTTFQGCMDTCSALIAVTGTACRGTPAKITCAWSSNPTNCTITLTCG
jgi:hypothetical protein